MKTVLLFLCMFWHLFAYTQDSTSKRPVFIYAVATYDFAKSYGVSAGASIPFHSVIAQTHHENLRGGTRKDKFIVGEFGIHRRPFAYTSAYFNVGAGVRFATSEKHFTELSIEQGVLRTFYDGHVYEEQSDGSIKELPLFGRTYARTGFSCAQIWNISGGTSNAWLILLKPCIWMQYPYNGFLKPHFSLHAGVSYHLSDVKVPTRIKYKHQS
jgi:hypothetical protein